MPERVTLTGPEQGTVAPEIAELIAAGDNLARLIAHCETGSLEVDMPALDRWVRALQMLQGRS